MDLLKYLIAGVGSFLLGIIVMFLSRNLLSGILLFVLLFGIYILINVLKASDGRRTDDRKSQNQDN